VQFLKELTQFRPVSDDDKTLGIWDFQPIQAAPEWPRPVLAGAGVSDG